MVTSQECTDTVGLLNHDDNFVTMDFTFILADYIVPCNATVVAWEFCYRISGATSVTFYPGIWRITGTNGSNTDYALVQSNTVTYNSTIRGPQDSINNCQTFNLSDRDQFTAPAGSVVGLYSNTGTQLLHANTDTSVTTYRIRFNQSSVTSTMNIEYNIAINVHLGKLIMV